MTLLCFIESRFPTDPAMLVPIPESHDIKSIECTMFTTTKTAITDTKITDSGLFHTDTPADITTPVNFLDVDWSETANPASAFPRKSQGVDRGSYYGNRSRKPDTTPGPKNVFPNWSEQRRQGKAKPVPTSRTIPTGGPRHFDSTRGDPRSKPFQFDNRSQSLDRSSKPFTDKAVELE